MTRFDLAGNSERAAGSGTDGSGLKIVVAGRYRPFARKARCTKFGEKYHGAKLDALGAGKRWGMAVFMDTGGGDIYAGETKEDCIAGMREDFSDEDFAEIEPIEVPGSTRMRVEHEDGTVDADESSTLDDEYTNLGYGYCIASENC